MKFDSGFSFTLTCGSLLAAASAFTISKGGTKLLPTATNNPFGHRMPFSSRARIDDDEEVDRKLSLSTQPGAELMSRGDRRKALTTLFGLTAASGLSLLGSIEAANAFDRSFPDELTERDNASGIITMGSRLNPQQRKSVAEATAQANRSNLQNFSIKEDLVPSVAWGAALWLLSGSRSNPLTTPLANLLYDEETEEWLRDRNEGLFASPPVPFLFVLGIVFCALGVVTQFLLLQLAEGDSDACLQLAGVSLIGGATLELGRIASGEKLVTREERDRFIQLRDEFAEFAEKRLSAGGNCHRSDIVSAFRRYFAKYRQKDSEKYPLTDLEIEKMLRTWNIRENQGRAEMTSSGFYYGIQINKDADVFV